MAILILDEFFNEKPYSYTQQLEQKVKYLSKTNASLRKTNSLLKEEVKELLDKLERFNEANKQLLERNSRLTASSKMYRKRIKEFSTNGNNSLKTSRPIKHERKKVTKDVKRKS